MNPSAANMQRIIFARDDHNATCRLGGSATEAHLNPGDLERMGWESGDSVGGLLIVGSDSVAPHGLSIKCSGEGTGSTLSAETAVEDLDLVGVPLNA